MSAASTRADRNRSTRNHVRAPETAFDVERILGASTADIPQLATLVRRLLASGPRQPSPQSPQPKTVPHLLLM